MKNMKNLLGPNAPQLSENDWPNFHCDIDLSNRPITYMDIRIKATVRKEKNEMLKHLTNEFAQIDDAPKDIFCPDLGQPEPHKLRGFKHSQQTFTIGSSMKMSMIHAMKKRLQQNVSQKIAQAKTGEEKDHVIERDFTADELKRAPLCQAIDEDKNEMIERWFQRQTKNIKSNLINQNKRWNSVTQKDRNFFANKDGYKNLREQLEKGSKQIQKTKRGLSLFENKEVRNCLVNDTNAPLLLEDEGLTDTLKKVLNETERAQVFQTIAQRVAKTNFDVCEDDDKEKQDENDNQDQKNSEDGNIAMDNLDEEERFHQSSPEKLAKFRSSRLRRNAKQITFPINPVLYPRKSECKSNHHILANIDRVKSPISRKDSCFGQQDRSMSIILDDAVQIAINDCITSPMMSNGHTGFNNTNNNSNGKLLRVPHSRTHLPIGSPTEQNMRSTNFNNITNSVQATKRGFFSPTSRNNTVVSNNVLNHTYNCSQMESQKVADATNNATNKNNNNCVNNTARLMSQMGATSQISSQGKPSIFKNNNANVSALGHQSMSKASDGQLAKVERRRGSKLNQSYQAVVPFMDDFCKKSEVFFNDDDCTKHKVLKSQSQFGLFRDTVDKIFHNPIDYPEVPGMKEFLQTAKQKQDEDQQLKTQKVGTNLSTSTSPLAFNGKIVQQLSAHLANTNRDQLHSPKSQNSESSLAEDFKFELQQKRLLVDQFHREQANKFVELENLQSKLDQNKLIKPQTTKAKRKQQNPVSKLSSRLSRFKNIHHTKEHTLKQIIDKLKLDKYILLKEKMCSVWNEDFYASAGGPHQIHTDLNRQKNARDKVYQQQLLAYDNVLDYVKTRGKIPVAEEKMLLDGIKLILDNGWTIRQDEMIQLCDLAGLQQKIFLDEAYKGFVEFVYVVVEMFGLDQEELKHYFKFKP